MLYKANNDIDPKIDFIIVDHGLPLSKNNKVSNRDLLEDPGYYIVLKENRRSSIFSADMRLAFLWMIASAIGSLFINYMGSLNSSHLDTTQGLSQSRPHVTHYQPEPIDLEQIALSELKRHVEANRTKQIRTWDLLTPELMKKYNVILERADEILKSSKN